MNRVCLYINFILKMTLNFLNLVNDIDHHKLISA